MIYQILGVALLVSALGYSYLAAYHVASDRFEAYLSTFILFFGLLFIQWRNIYCRRLALLIACASGGRYFIFRLSASLALNSLPNAIASLVLYFAELHFFINLCLITYFMWGLERPPDQDFRPAPPRPSNFLPSVDIFISAVDEPFDMVKRTILGALNINYPNKKIHLLDDGNRADLAGLAKELDLGYLVREERKYGKGGNIDNGMRNTQGEFVLTLDADHLAADSILENTLGFFAANEKVAAVQTANAYRNPAPCERNLRLIGVLPTELRAIFQVYLVALAEKNCAFWFGSGAVLRRKAIDDIGGIPLGTVSEERHTSFKLEKRGWLFEYNPLPQVLALTPESLRAYLIQNARWFKGTMQLLLCCNPTFMKESTLAQRLASIQYAILYLAFIPRLIFIFITPAAILFKVSPINVVSSTYMIVFAPYIILMLAVISYLFGRHYLSFFWDLYDFIKTPAYCKALLELFAGPKKAVYVITPKGIDFAKPVWQVSFAIPYFLLLCLCLYSLSFDITGLIKGWDFWGFLNSTIWCLYFCMLLICCICITVEEPLLSSEQGVPCDLIAELIEAGSGTSYSVTLNSCHDTGGVLKTKSAELPKCTNFNLRLKKEGDQTVVEVPCRSIAEGGKTSSQLDFVFMSESIDTATMKKLLHLTVTSNKLWQQRDGREAVDVLPLSFLKLAATPARVAAAIARRGLQIVG